MKLVALTTIYLGKGKSHPPGTEFDVADEKEARDLVARKAAARPKAVRAKDDEDDGSGQGAAGNQQSSSGSSQQGAQKRS